MRPHGDGRRPERVPNGAVPGCPPSCLLPGEPSSQTSAAYAGWSRSKHYYEEHDPGAGTEPGAETGRWHWVDDEEAYGHWDPWLKSIRHRRWRDFSWLAAGPLLDSANDQVAKVVHDLVNDRRQRWIAAQRAAGKADDDFVLEQPDASRFFIVGDPGESDPSQYAVVDPLLKVDQTHESDFMLVLSDVIYPAGDVNDYVNGFFIPYARYQKPIYALPGNHDWYDGLNGFMFHFCGAEALPPERFRGSSYTAPERIAQWLWRQSSRPFRVRLMQHRYDRTPNKAVAWKPPQPAPYFALDVGDDVRLVSIDTGIRGTIDREQGEWLIRVSAAGDKVKILLTGKPLWVDGRYDPCPIDWGEESTYPGGYETVDDIVRDPANGYVASIGGDIHNYQRYCVRVVGERDDDPCNPREPSRRTIQYLVAGGGGAYMSATHRFGVVDNRDREELLARSLRLDGQQYEQEKRPRKIKPPETVEDVTEEHFACYPRRGDSLAFYARWFGQRVARATTTLTVLSIALLVAGFVFWNGSGTEIGDQSVEDVFWASLMALVVLAAFVGVVALLGMLAPRGYKFPGVLLSIPLVVFGLLALVRTIFGSSVWSWAVPAGLLTLGAIALPLVVVLVVYYGLGSTGRPASELILPRTLVLGFLAVGVAAAWIPSGVYTSDLALAIPAALAAVALLLWLVALTRPTLGTIGRFIAARPWLNGPATVIAYAAFVVPLVVRFWDLWAIKVTVVGAAAGSIALTLALLILLLVTGGLRAMPFLFQGRVDPAKAMRYLIDEGGAPETLPVRVAASTNRKTRWVCSFLTSKLVGSLISEAGNADAPPMFKSFLHAEIEKEPTGRTKLRISCYGVTGWRAHDELVPREDCVEIDISAAREELATRHAVPAEQQMPVVT